MNNKKFFILIFAVLLINSISALSFDDMKKYDGTTETFTIKNNFGLGSNLIKGTLKTPKDLRVGMGYQNVGRFNLTYYEVYNNLIKEFNFYQKGTNQEISKNVDIKYLTYKTILEDRGYKDCSSGECKRIITHQEEVQKEVWNDWNKFDISNLKNGDTITMGIFTNVQKGDSIEWIPTISTGTFGDFEISEWASWTADMNINLTFVFPQNESSGTNVENVHNSSANLTTYGSPAFATAYIGNSLNFTATQNANGSNYLIENWTDLTISFWARPVADATVRRWFDFEGGVGDVGVDLGSKVTSTYISFGEGNNFAYNAGVGVWSHFTFVKEGTNRSLYVNGTIFGSIVEVGDHPAIGYLWLGSHWNGPAEFYKGQVDEFYLWERVLTPFEIENMANGSYAYAATIEDANPIITLNNPQDYYNSSSPDITFNCSATDDNAVLNLSLIIDDVINYTIFNSTANQNLSLETTIGISEGDHNWTCLGYDNSTQIGVTSNRTFNVDSQEPSIIINYPTSSIDYIVKGNNLTLNFTVSDQHLSSCWFDYNSTNVSVGCYENISYFNVTNYNNRNLTFYANDTNGNLNSSFIEWTYKIFANSQSYNSTVYETENTLFMINISHESSEALSAIFYYDGISRGASTKQKIGDETIFNKDIDVALTNSTSNKPFFWSINYGATNINTSISNQSVSPIFLTLCNATIEDLSLNFTLFDEETGEKINATQTATNYQTNFLYWLGNGEITKNYSYSLLGSTTNINYSFCIDPKNRTFYSNMASLYDCYGYSEREYNLDNASLTNSSSDINLYLLNDSSSVKFTQTVKEGVVELDNAYVIVSKYFIGEGSYKTISIRTTDDGGQFVEYLELDRDHKYTIVKDGEVRGIVEKKSTCEAAPCGQTIQISGDQGNLWSGYYDLYAQNVVSNLSFNSTSKIVTYDFVDTTGLANYFRLEVYEVRLNETQDLLCNNFSYTTAGSILCDLSSFDGDFIAKTYISRSPEKVDKVITILISQIATDLGLLGIFFTIILIITLVFVGGVLSQGNPTVMISMFGLAVLATKLMMILPFSWGIISLIELLVIVIISYLQT